MNFLPGLKAAMVYSAHGKTVRESDDPIISAKDVLDPFIAQARSRFLNEGGADAT